MKATGPIDDELYRLVAEVTDELEHAGAGRADGLRDADQFLGGSRECGREVTGRRLVVGGATRRGAQHGSR